MFGSTMLQAGNISVVFFFCLRLVYSCTSSVQHKQIGDNVTLSFQATTTNSIDSSSLVSNLILSSNGSTLLAVVYRGGTLLTNNPTCNGCMLTGNPATGLLSVMIDNLQVSDGGIFKHTVKEAVQEEKGCVIVYILGTPVKPTIQSDNNNIEGRNVQLTCSSSSTTQPSDPSLNLQYDWKVDNVKNPSVYEYSQTKNTLTVKNLNKQDATKRFICNATESSSTVTGLTSVDSDVFRINVLYGPDSGTTTLSPPNVNYIGEEYSNLGDITCSAVCNPDCSFKWTKPGSDVSNNNILSLKSLDRNKAATYTCTVNNPTTGTTVTKTVIVNVVYGPDANAITLTPGKTSHTVNEGTRVTDIECRTNCYPDCNYQWKKSGAGTAASTTGVLSLGTANRKQAGVYTCTATNPRKSGSDTKQVTVNVRYGPDSSTTTLSPSNVSYILEENSNLGDITCSAVCNPDCTFKWTKPGSDVSNNNILSLGSLNRNEAATYTCTVNNPTTGTTVTKTVMVNVIYGPDANAISLTPAKTSHTVNEDTPVTNIECSTDCYPDCNYQWKKSGAGTAASTTGVLSLGTANRKQAGVYTCTATNPQKSGSDTKQVTVNVRYGPDRCAINKLSPLVLTEGFSESRITCTSDCYPSCANVWKNVSDSNHVIAINGDLVLNPVTRYEAGSYICSCQNTFTKISSNSALQISVHYKPDVSISMSTNNISEGNPLSMICNATGVPDKYNFKGFKQRWDGSIVPNKHSAINGTNPNSSINIPSLQLKDSGTYTCYVNNNVTTPAGILEDSFNSVTIKVKVVPKILTSPLRFTGATSGSSDISIQFYSFPDVTSFMLQRSDGVTINNISSSRHTLLKRSTDVQDIFYGIAVQLNGSEIKMKITNLTQDDFTNYTLTLINEIGTKRINFMLAAESVPSIPQNFQYIFKDGVHAFTWKGDFNGGYKQTFVIQLSPYNTENWSNQTWITENEQSYLTKDITYQANISDLSPGTYRARLFSWNNIGRTEFIVLNASIIVKENSEGGESFPVIAVVLATVAAVIVIAIVVVVMVFYKRRNSKKGKAHRDDTNDRKPIGTDENEYGMQDNPMYVSAGPRNQEQARGNGLNDASAVYSVVDKKKLVSSKNDVYAEVDKTKKTKEIQGKREKKEKNKPDKKRKKEILEGDLYENATAPFKSGTSGKDKITDEIIYENPEPTKLSEKKNVNKDGLIYADLTFNDQPKGQKKLVIHGLDDMTEYVQVDFTKKAEPLPDSDDENNPPK